MSPVVRSAAFAAVVVCALLPGKGRAQQVGTTVRSIWTSSIGYLGIDNLKCNCTFRSELDGTGRLFIFRSEPVVLGIVPGSPAAGVMHRGDTIAEIDGISLLTSDGAQRFANIRPGQRLGLTVRRGGNLLRLRLTAGEIDPDDPRAMGSFTPQAPGAYGTTWYELPPIPPHPGIAPTPVVPQTPPGVTTPSTPAPRVMPRPVAPGVWPVEPGVWPVAPAVPARPAFPATPTLRPSAPRPPVGAIGGTWAATVPFGPTSPLGWFGFSIRCSGCGWSAGPGESPVWESDTTPELSMVSPNSPAGRAGLRAGDRLTHIDGLSILTSQGARRFGGVKPGQKVKLTVLRDGRSITRELTLGTRPEVRAAIAATPPTPARPATPPATRRELRYNGKIDDVSVEVWSPGGPTVERVGDTMIITIGGSVVRLRVDPKSK